MVKPKKYFSELTEKLSEVDTSLIENSVDLIKKLKKKNKIILAGNGASSSIASHLSTDFTKSAGFRAINFNEANLLTCYSNDFGYEKWIEKALQYYALSGDILILISSSGKSKNIINGAKLAKRKKMKLLTLSGLDKKNPLKKLGNINFFVNSKNYNIVENTHLAILLSIVESLANKK